MLLDGLGGAISDTPANGTAFPHRGALFQMQYNVKVDAATVSEQRRVRAAALMLARVLGLRAVAAGQGGERNKLACSDWLGAVYRASDGQVSDSAYSNYPALDLPDWQHSYYAGNCKHCTVGPARVF